MDHKKIGAFIAARRKERGLTQKQLAGELGVTNKAVSKWETGAGLPDVTIFPVLSEALGVTVDELMQAGEAVFDFGNGKEEEVRERRISDKRRRILGGLCLAAALSLCTGQAVYGLMGGQIPVGRTFFQRSGPLHGYEYIWDGLFYAVNAIALILFMVAVWLLAGRRKKLVKGAAVLLAALFLLNGAGLLWTEGRTAIVEISPDGRQMLLLKHDRASGRMTYYRNRILLFARPKEDFPYTVEGRVKKQWLAEDICAVTYQSPDDGQVHQFVATYGDRGDGITTPYVNTLVDGTWRAVGNDMAGWQLTNTLGGIRIENEAGLMEEYAYSDCVQFGSLAIALCKNGLPIWTLALSGDSVIGENDLLTKDSHILLCRVAMAPTAPVEFVRTAP